MAALIPKLEHYKLETEFGDGYVAHTTYEWELSSRGQGKRSTWKPQKQVGSGGFGSVWLEEDKEKSQLRAVKTLDRGSLSGAGFSQELLALVKLKEAGAPRYYTHYLWANGRGLCSTKICS